MKNMPGGWGTQDQGHKHKFKKARGTLAPANNDFTTPQTGSHHVTTAAQREGQTVQTTQRKTPWWHSTLKRYSIAGGHCCCHSQDRKWQPGRDVRKPLPSPSAYHSWETLLRMAVKILNRLRGQTKSSFTLALQAIATEASENIH